MLVFVVECLLSLGVGVAPRAQIVQERFVLLLAREVVAAAQQQRLLDRALEAMMTLLAIAVLVTRVGVDRLRLDSVVCHQRLIAARELVRPRSLHRQTHAIRAMSRRHSAQRPHRVLEPVAETRETLREAKRRVLPVRVRQHEVIEHMVKGQTVDGHAQIVHDGEVRGAQPAGRMHLREENFLRRSARGLPFLDAPLQRPQLTVGETARMPPLQFLEERLGLPARAGHQQFFDFGPHVDERIRPRPIRPRRRLGRPLQWQPVRMPILACRLAIHARLRRRQLQRRSSSQPGPENPNLVIRDYHRATPSRRRERATA